MNRRFNFLLTLLLVLGSLSAHCVQARKRSAVALGSHRPIIAVWCDFEGRYNSEAPYLRIALWEDGRVLFAKDTKKWNHSLQQGRLSKEQLAELKKRIAKTGVFDLQGTCYLVPDAPVDCIMVDFGTQRQMLYWDERESPNYGINNNPKPQHLNFKKCWKAVNKLVLAIRPAVAKPIKGQFVNVPRFWYLKRSVQSE